MSNEDTRKAKQAVRQKMLEERRTLSRDRVTEAGAAVVRHILQLEVYRNAQTVCLFSALDGEILLDALRTDRLAAGCRVLLPAWRPESKDYGFKEWSAGTDLQPGHWGVMEPAVEAGAVLRGRICMFVPGLAFDVCGGRIGYGRGYYDRLQRLPVEDGSLTTVGVCFERQLFADALPQEPWDIRVDGIVTERRTVWCGTEKFFKQTKGENICWQPY